MFAQLWQVQQISDEAGSLSVNCGGCLHQRVWVITLTCFLFKISLYDHLADVPPPSTFTTNFVLSMLLCQIAS